MEFARSAYRFGKVLQDVYSEFYYSWLYSQNYHHIGRAMVRMRLDSALNMQAHEILATGNWKEGYHSPLFAFIIALCPNLTDLTVHLEPLAKDPWFDWVLSKATRQNTYCILPYRPLQRVKTPAVTRKMQDPGLLPEDKFDQIVLGNERPFYRLLQLQELIAFFAFTSESIVPDVDDHEQIPGKNTQQLTLHRSHPGHLKLPTLNGMEPRAKAIRKAVVYDIPVQTQLEYLDLYQENWIHLNHEHFNNQQSDPKEDVYENWKTCHWWNNSSSSRFEHITSYWPSLPSCAQHKAQSASSSPSRSLGLYTTCTTKLWGDEAYYQEEFKGLVTDGSPLRAVTTDSYLAPTDLLVKEARKRGVSYIHSGGQYSLFLGGAKNSSMARSRMNDSMLKLEVTDGLAMSEAGERDDWIRGNGDHLWTEEMGGLGGTVVKRHHLDVEDSSDEEDEDEKDNEGKDDFDYDYDYDDDE
ncbi:hypothetical protein BDV06DRAFT_220103 [Aspergillus oleicola]